MVIWSKCDICGRDIPVGELCYGLKKGNCICKDCCTGFENCTFTLAPAPTLTPPNEPLSPYPDGDMSIIACPHCGSGEYLHNEDGNEQNYCGQCGQAIDWSRPSEGEA